MISLLLFGTFLSVYLWQNGESLVEKIRDVYVHETPPSASGSSLSKTLGQFEQNSIS